MKKISTILLDIDGTIFSSHTIIHDVYFEEISKFKKKHKKPKSLPELSAIMKQVGNPPEEIYKNLLPELNDRERDVLGKRILKHLVHRINAGEGEYYEGVFETVKKLHLYGYRLFAASNGRENYVRAVLTAGQMINFFEEIWCVDGKNIENKNELVTRILKEKDLTPGNVLLVGDRKSDRDAALFNKCRFAACSYGHGSNSEHTGADIFLSCFKELEDFLIFD